MSEFRVSEPHEHQKRFIEYACEPGVKYACFFGGLQAGKTMAGADACRELLYGGSPLVLPGSTRGKMSGEFWILSKSYALVDTAVATFRARMPPEAWMSDVECRKAGLKRHDARTWWLVARSGCGDDLPVCLRARTAADPEAFRATPTLLMAWADEIAHWKELSWKNLQGRAIVARTKYVVTTTPKGKNWLYRDLFVPGTARPPEDGVRVVQCRSVDNPYADQEFLRKLRAKFGPAYAEQELDALFTANVGYVYDFDRTRHLRRLPSLEPSKYVSRVIGVDPGFGDPYAASCWLKDLRGTWWKAAEMYLPKKAVVDDALPWLRETAKRWEVSAVYVDKRRPSDWTLLRKAGLNALPNVDVFGEDDRRTIMPMVRMIQRLFRENRIFFAPECEWSAEEYENYAYPDRDERNAGENPVDFKNHLCFVAGTRVLTRRGNVPIQQVHPGDLAWTRRGWRRVVKAAETNRETETVELLTSDGRRLRGTPEHPVWVVGSGWKPIDALRYGDRLTARSANGSSSKASPTGGIQRPRADPIGSPSPPNADDACTSLSTSTPMGSRFRKAYTFITETGIRSTTPWETLSSNVAEITSQTPPLQSAAPRPPNDFQKSATLRPPGTHLQKAWRGIKNTALRSRDAQSQNRQPVDTAATRIGADALAVFAPTHASPRHEGDSERTASAEPASSAARHSTPVGSNRPDVVRVVAVRVCEKASVYALSVADVHEYFANGILVSNCDADRYAICSVDALPEDRRPRYRRGAQLIPTARGGRRKAFVLPSAEEAIAEQDRKFDLKEQGHGRRRFWTRPGRKP